MVRPTKTVEYKPTIDNKIVRVTPARFPVENYIELGWQSVDHEFRNLFYDLFVNDTKFTNKSHLWDASKSELRKFGRSRSTNLILSTNSAARGKNGICSSCYGF